MRRRSVRVSPDVRLLNSGEVEKVSVGHLRAAPRSHSHPFVTISSSRDTAVVKNQGNVWGVGTDSIPWGKANYRLKAPVWGMQLTLDESHFRTNINIFPSAAVQNDTIQMLKIWHLGPVGLLTALHNNIKWQSFYCQAADMLQTRRFKSLRVSSTSRRSQMRDVKGQTHPDTVLGGLVEYVGHQAPTWLYAHR